MRASNSERSANDRSITIENRSPQELEIAMAKNELMGTWALQRFELRFPDGTVTHPYGEKVTGLLMYDATGHMSAAFGSADRAGSDADLADVDAKVHYDAFMAYCGRYEVEGSRITHRVSASSLEAWTGSEQERSYRIEGQRLTLETMPLKVAGDAPTGVLVWDRVHADDWAE